MFYICCMQEEIDRLPKEAKEQFKENKKFLERLRQKPPKKLDVIMQNLHEKTFDQIDCLECANCCKTTAPIVTDRDTERIAKHLKMKAVDFEQKYVKVDSDGDQVFKNTPCEFLAHDNYCLIYDVRPKACSEYPHTNRKRFHQLNKVTLANTSICPATFRMVEKLKAQFGVLNKKEKQR